MSVHVFDDSATPATAKQIDEQVKISDGPVYVFYSHPSIYVAYGLEKGIASNELFDAWLVGLNEALDAQRKNRRKVRLLCIQDALEQSRELFKKSSLKVDELTEFKVTPDQFMLMVGHQLVLQNGNIGNFFGRLEACTMYLSDHVYQLKIDVESALEKFNNAVDCASDASRELALIRSLFQKGKDENELLSLQLQQVQEDFEQQFIENRTLKQQLAQLEKRSEKLVTSAFNEFDEKKSVQTEYEHETYKHRNKELEKENKVLLEHIQQLKDEQKSCNSPVYTSSRKEVIDPAKLKEMEEENEFLLLHLKQLQCECETYLVKYQDSEKRRAQELFKSKQSAKFMTKDKLLAEKDLEIAKLNQRLIKLQLKSPSGDLSSSKDAPKAADGTKKTVRLGLLSRIKRRLKIGQRRKDKDAWINEQIDHLNQTDYFDSEWYLQKYPDVEEAGVNPAEHYLRFGAFEARNPSTKFNSVFYLQQNPDVAKEGINPLIHYILFGEAEGRLPKPRIKDIEQ
ncbi:hypothetical protein [uncultured Idiomarina sp.]|nr:hypothetical protein [Idiomarinaceae bacterium]